MISSGINLVMTVIGFAVSTMFIVFVCTRLICARIQLHASRRSFPVSSRSDLSILERGIHGLEPPVIATFPIKKYSNAFFYSVEDAQCAVCLSEYQGEDTLRVLPYCGHSFHASCIDKWLQQHSTCPVCRISLRECPEKKLEHPMFSSAIQSRQGTESLDTNICPCLSTSPGISTRVHDELRMMDAIQENRVAPENGAESRDSISMIEDENAKKVLTDKHVESPSNV